MIDSTHFFNFIENSKCAYIVANFKEASIIYTNHAAKTLYGVTTQTKDLEPLFKEHSKGLYPMFLTDMKERGEGVALIPDVKILTVDGTIALIDLHLGYFDQENFLVYLEILPKKIDHTLFFRQIIDESKKPVLVLEKDSQLSIRYCSPRTREKYDIKEDSIFADCFLPEEKASILQGIHEHFQGNPEEAFYKHLQLHVQFEQKVWYALNLEQITLGPEDKPLICTLTCIEEQISVQEELNDVNQYFNILQSLCKGLLYRFDIKTRTLYRNEETARVYHVPVVTHNFPPQDWLEKMIHPDDIKSYSDFIDSVVAGDEGDITSRLRTPSGDFQYHEFTFKAVRRKDGSIKEMVGCAMNVHNLKSTQKELESINQYFSILQKLTTGLLYRFDIKNKILYRNEETAQFYGVPTIAENYPKPEKLKGVFHKEDIADYVNFIHFVLSGGEGSHFARLFSPSGKYEYHKITFKAVKNSDGSVKEMVGNAVNVQDLKEAQLELSNVNRYFDILQSFSNDLLYRLNLKTKTLYRNENTSAYYGIPPVVEDYPNFESLNGVFHPDDIEHYVTFIKKVLEGEEGTHTARLISPSGNFEFHKFTFRKPVHEDGLPEEMIGHAVNIHSLMELEKKASYDMLTNCLNKISFQEQVCHILENSAIGHRHALFFIDLDDFKGINDNLGHTFGDFLLKTIGTRLKRLVRDNDLVGRVGGDEFVIFLEDCGDDMHLAKRGVQILETLREEYLQNSTTATIKGSVGIAVYPHHGTSYEVLYENADKALYRSKHLGKNVATIYYKGLGE